MKYGSIIIANEDGKILSQSKVEFWNASLDESEPGLCIAINGKELKKLLDINLPKDPLLQIVLPIDDIKEVI
jgi:hypothetical protein